MKKSVWFLFGCSVLAVMPVQAECPSMDITGDCRVDLADFAVVSRWWLDACDASNSWCMGADLFQSGSVNLDDLVVMVSLWQTNQLPGDMVAIPAGTFQMGDSKGEGNPWDELLPVHTVTVDSFAMGKYEMTNGQYRDFLNSALAQGLITVTNGVVYKAGSGTSYPYCDTSTSISYSKIAFSNNTFSVQTKGGKDMTNHPMVDVSWYGAVAYCNWRSQQEGKQTCYNLSTWACDFSKKGYRLATEAEWEYAARGGLSGNRFPWGDTINQTQANFYSFPYSYDVSPVKYQCHPLWDDGIYPYTSPVGFFASGANAYGLYDMAGNVWEWCNDWRGSYSSSSQTNPTGSTTGDMRVLRGGSWGNRSDSCRVAFRIGNNPNACNYNYGFRLVLDFE